MNLVEDKDKNILNELTLPYWINWGTILSTVVDGMAKPTPADVPAIPTIILSKLKK